MTRKLLSNNRFWILIVGILFSFVLVGFVQIQYPEGSLRIIRLTQLYGFTAVLLLYLALLASPLCFVFPFLPYKEKYIHARRALGVSSFYFASLHGANAFFRQLGGFAGLGFLSQSFLTGIVLSSLALFILFLLTLTSTDAMTRKLTYKRWKLLHRTVYAAGILILIHVLMLGSHFTDLSTLIPTVFFVLLAFLLITEGIRFDAYLQKSKGITIRLGIATVVAVSISLVIFVLLNLPDAKNSPFGVHATHTQMNSSDSMSQMDNSLIASMPGMQGDPKQHYTISFLHPDTVAAQSPVPLSFDVYDAASGNSIYLFQTPYEKPFHLIILDRQFRYFDHIHPQLDDKKHMSIVHTFPADGVYNLYTDFQPFGGREQQVAFNLTVGKPAIQEPIIFEPDTNFTKEVDDYLVTLDFPHPLTSQSLNQGSANFTVHIENKNTHQPVTTLSPYLNAYGHFIMVNTRTYQYTHVHPRKTLLPGSTTLGGPDIEFIPMSLYGNISYGTYRVYIELHPDNTSIIPVFTIQVE